MHNPRRFVLLFFVNLFLCASIVVVGQQEAPPEYVLEFTGQILNGYQQPITITESEKTGAIFSFGLRPARPPVAERTSDAANSGALNSAAPTPTPMYYRFNAYHDKPNFRLRIYQLELPPDHEDAQRGNRETLVAEYQARENEPITVKELQTADGDNVRLKIVRYVLPLPPPAPQAVSRIKAVEVIGVREEQQERQLVQILTLRNAGQKDILMLDVFSESGGGHTSQYTSFGTDSIFSAGETRDHEVRLFDEGNFRRRETGGNQARIISVGTVIFTDGTFEGEARTALSFYTNRIGGYTQAQRAAQLLDKILTDGRIADADLIETFERQINNLPTVAEPTLLAEMPRELSTEKIKGGADEISNWLQSALRNGREGILLRLKELKRQRSYDPQNFNPRSKLLELKANLERQAEQKELFDDN